MINSRDTEKIKAVLEIETEYDKLLLDPEKHLGWYAYLCKLEGKIIEMLLDKFEKNEIEPKLFQDTIVAHLRESKAKLLKSELRDFFSDLKAPVAPPLQMDLKEADEPPAPTMTFQETRLFDRMDKDMQAACGMVKEVFGPEAKITSHTRL